LHLIEVALAVEERKITKEGKIMTTTTQRGRGEGSLFYDKDQGLWTGQLTYRDPATNRRVYRQASAKTKSAARAKLATLKEAMAKAGSVASSVLTVRHAVENLLASPPARWHSPQTAAVNATHASRIIAAIGQVKLTDLTAQMVEVRLLHPMAKRGMATTTMVRTRGLLRVALNKAMRDHGLSRNVAELAEVPNGTVRVSQSMTKAQALQLLASDMTPFWRA